MFPPKTHENRYPYSLPSQTSAREFESIFLRLVFEYVDVELDHPCLGWTFAENMPAQKRDMDREGHA